MTNEKVEYITVISVTVFGFVIGYGYMCYKCVKWCKARRERQRERQSEVDDVNYTRFIA